MKAIGYADKFSSDKQQVSTLSFLLLLSFVLESLVDKLQTLIKKVSKIINCLLGRTKQMALDTSPEKKHRKDVISNLI